MTVDFNVLLKGRLLSSSNPVWFVPVRLGLLNQSESTAQSGPILNICIETRSEILVYLINRKIDPSVSVRIVVWFIGPVQSSCHLNGPIQSMK